MSATSVVNPVCYGGSVHSGGRPSSSPDAREKKRVMRNLFGSSPFNRDELTKFCQDKLAEQQKAAECRWGFDFKRGCPATDTHERYKWEPVSGRLPTAQPPPPICTAIRSAHTTPRRTESPRRRRQILSPTLDDLLDKRADASNQDHLLLFDANRSPIGGGQSTEEEDELMDEFGGSASSGGLKSKGSPTKSSLVAERRMTRRSKGRQTEITEFLKVVKRSTPTKKLQISKKTRKSLPTLILRSATSKQ